VSGDDFEVEPEKTEIFYLTVPDDGAPRKQPIKGRIIRSWRHTPEAAQQFEESFTRTSPDVRIRIRVYRGERELLPERDEVVLPSTLEEPVAAGPNLGAAAGLQQHLQLLNDSIKLAHARLASLEAEIEQARGRRDRELAAHQTMIDSAQTAALVSIKQSRDHVTSERQRAFELDQAAWRQVTEQGVVLKTVQDMLRSSVLANNLEKYLGIGATMLKGLSESQIGQVMSFTMATTIAEQVQARLGARGTNGEGRRATTHDVLVSAVINGGQFNERRELLAQFSVLAPPQLGQALLLGPAYCIGQAPPEAIQELITQANATSTT